MNKKNITKFLVSKLNKIKKIEKKYLDNIDNYNFIATGHVDSIEILKFNFNNFFVLTKLTICYWIKKKKF